MNRHDFDAMGTHWAVMAQDCDPAWLQDAEAQVRDIESRLSRFLPDSELSKLNRDRSANDSCLAEVLREALRLQNLTDGKFDPTLGARLVALGYDRPFYKINRPSVQLVALASTDLQVHVDSDVVTLKGEGFIDLGGIAKGWTVDKLVEGLAAKGATNILVDGGGDIRVLGGEWPLGVGERFSITLSQGAIATSSTRRRRWTSAQGKALHHIVDPVTGMPANANIDTVTVVAPTATSADAFATAALVDFASQLPRFLEADIQAAVRGLAGDWYTTPNWRESR